MTFQELYRQQLRKVLGLTYRKTLSDMLELAGAKAKIEAKSKDNIYKIINLEEIERRLKETGF